MRGRTLFRLLPLLPHDTPRNGIDTYDDHRIAMCFSLVALAAPLRINDPGCVAKTFPDYFERFASVTQPVPVIAIDGPSASGKGTVAARVAAALGWHYLDSGALYRLTALAARRAGISWDDEVQVAAIAAGLDVVFSENSILLGGVEVSEDIRQEEIFRGIAGCRTTGRAHCTALPSACVPSGARSGGRWSRYGFGRVSRCADQGVFDR